MSRRTARRAARGFGLWRVLAFALVLGAMPGATAQDAPEPPPPPPPAAPPPEPADGDTPEPLAVEPLDSFYGRDRAPIDDDGREIVVAPDTLAARDAPAAMLQRYRADPDFQYDSPEAEGPSLWDRIMRWLGQTFIEPLFRGLGSRGGSNLLILLAVVLLAWVVTRLLRADAGPLFGRKDLKASGAGAGPLLDVEDILEVDVSTMLSDALARGDLREAVRFRYVLALQSLAQKGAVTWRRDTTNREYVQQAREAGGAALAGPFADATRAFDYVWYGERAVDQARYNRLEPLFERMDAALAAQNTRRQRPEPA